MTNQDYLKYKVEMQYQSYLRKVKQEMMDSVVQEKKNGTNIKT